MLKTSEYRILSALGIASVILVGVNISLYLGNRSTQLSVNARAQYIQQTTPIRELYQDIAKALAELSVKNNDDAVRGMLSQEGFTINQTSAKPTAPTPTTRGKQ